MQEQHRTGSRQQDIPVCLQAQAEQQSSRQVLLAWEGIQHVAISSQRLQQAAATDTFQ